MSYASPSFRIRDLVPSDVEMRNPVTNAGESGGATFSHPQAADVYQRHFHDMTTDQTTKKFILIHWLGTTETRQSSAGS